MRIMALRMYIVPHSHDELCGGRNIQQYRSYDDDDDGADDSSRIIPVVLLPLPVTVCVYDPLPTNGNS